VRQTLERNAAEVGATAAATQGLDREARGLETAMSVFVIAPPAGATR
jgi:hypothetical protein